MASPPSVRAGRKEGAWMAGQPCNLRKKGGGRPRAWRAVLMLSGTRRGARRLVSLGTDSLDSITLGLESAGRAAAVVPPLGHSSGREQ